MKTAFFLNGVLFSLAEGLLMGEPISFSSSYKNVRREKGDLLIANPLFYKAI